MGNQGEALFKFIEEVRVFAADLDALIGSVEVYVKDQGWLPFMQQNFCIPNTSITLGGNARTWFPTRVFRFYASSARPSALAFCSVLLDNEAAGSVSLSLTEPLLTGGLLTFPPGQGLSKVSMASSWWSVLHAWMPARTDDGRPCHAEPATAWPDECKAHPAWYPFHRIDSLGVPLVSVQDEPALTSQFLEPFGKLLAQAQAVRTAAE